MTTAADTLSERLGAPLPEAFSRLSEAQLTELDHVLSAASERRAAQMHAAFESGLQMIPRLLRPAVKKALGL
ncbi:hypothetical protein [Nocardia cyriacigeorgica]|uniref:hypothetical protein n=1 Tax=Nocardia cyriacigeorgica TaxID=135487 RepID=UPI0013CFE38D|nr:hypothetical protein [Nocardia cyriacigeorgica]MBF6454920.1 hypothetical protein [Nocardia cyriacigeorgica]MBF6480885.1 hypothetical protein [Nocardia cyriacigeorgica]MBF6552815.1 hypothetical protein [Nocardia cyriacigeorgica]NEW28974.1 hypothetical protein [Nocardia cyriacigeorgica]